VKSALRKVLTLPRWVSFPVVLASLVGAIALCYPGGLSAAYADLRDANRLNAEVEEYKANDRQMGARMCGVRERIEYKEELVTALIRGQTTLTTVTDQFAEMDGGDERSLLLQRAHYGDLPETELAARGVLEYVRIRVAADGGSSVVLSRLHAEYERRFGHPAPRG
jgi:hypothetical protein